MIQEDARKWARAVAPEHVLHGNYFPCYWTWDVFYAVHIKNAHFQKFLILYSFYEVNEDFRFNDIISIQLRHIWNI